MSQHNYTKATPTAPPHSDQQRWIKKEIEDEVGKCCKLVHIHHWLKKFMQVGADEKCMYTNLVGVTSPISEIFLLFKNGQISLSDHGLKFNQLELAQKIHASRH